MPLVDFHTHILPGIDDGSRSVEQSIAMLQNEARQGIRKVIASPHFYPNHESPQRFLAKRQEAEKRLREAMKDVPDLPEVLVGAEVYFFEGISDCEFLHDMAIAGTDYVMIEMPMKPWSDRNLQELVGIRQKQKLTPIIAHMDRYMRPFQNHKIPDQLADLPVLIQVNAEFFKGWNQRLALRLFKHKMIHLIGSDCHNLNTRMPNMELAVQALTRAYGEDALQQIIRTEEKILAQM